MYADEHESGMVHWHGTSPIRVRLTGIDRRMARGAVATAHGAGQNAEIVDEDTHVNNQIFITKLLHFYNKNYGVLRTYIQ